MSLSFDVFVVEIVRNFVARVPIRRACSAFALERPRYERGIELLVAVVAMLTKMIER